MQQHQVVAGLYASESASLRRHLARKLDNPEQAEDAMHDAYLRMLDPRVEAMALSKPKAFLFAVASNLMVDEIRAQRRTSRLLALMPGIEIVLDEDELHIVCPRPGLEQQVDAQQRLTQVLNVLDDLPSKCRAAFVLHKFHERSYAEVARQLGVTVSMIEKYLSMALERLRGHPELFDD